MYLIWYKWFVCGHRWSKIAFFDIIQVLLCQSNTCNLWIGIYHTRNSIIGNALQWQLLQHTSYCHLGLTTSHMGQHNLTRHIACGIYILEVCLHKLIHHNTATIDLNIVQRIQSLHICASSYGYQYMLCLVFSVGCQYFISLYLSHFGISKDLNTRLAIFLQQDGYHLLIQVWQDGWHRLNHSYWHA